MRNRVARIALQYVGLGRIEIGEPTRRLWCGALVNHVLSSAGLAVPALGDTPGFTLTRELSQVQPLDVKVGDIVRYVSGLEHYAVIAGLMPGPFGFNALMVEGASGDEKVTSCYREISRFAGINWGWPREYYSIQTLIDRYEMTGASTGEVA